VNAIELIAALKGADEETAMELVERLQCGEIDCSVLPTGKDNAVLQAQIWAQEARTQKGIVEEIGKLVGCANDWEMVDAIKAALSANGGEAVSGGRSPDYYEGYRDGWNNGVDAPSPDHIADAGKVAFVDGLGAQRMTAEECKEGIEYIIHGDNIYWPLSDDDELRLIQAACGNGEFTYPQATPSVPENEVKARAVEKAFAQLASEYAPYGLRNTYTAFDVSQHIGSQGKVYAARLRTAGDEGEE
jgi:hypothetical protein